MLKKNIPFFNILSLLFLLLFFVVGCNYKNAKHFSPTGSALSGTIPSLPELEGPFGVTYTYTQNTCDNHTGEFNTTATVQMNQSNSNWIDIQFPDAPSAISGPYDEATGNFMGETDRKPIGQGYTAQEMWDMDFYPQMSNDDIIAFGGISRVDVYNPDDSFYCGIDYTIYGEKTALAVPQLVYPANGSMDTDLNITFEWQNVDQATAYDLQIIKDGESFQNANSFSQSGLTTNMYPVKGLEYQTNYQWRVRATAGDKFSDWSNPWGFSTMEEPPTLYTLTVQKEGMGSVSSEDGAISCGDACKADFEEGSDVTLTAEAEDGWFFDSWSGDVPDSCSDETESCVIVMDGEKMVTATFVEEEPFSLFFPNPFICIEHGQNQSEILWLWTFAEALGGRYTVTMRITLPNGTQAEIDVTSSSDAKKILLFLTIKTFGNYAWEITNVYDENNDMEIPFEGNTEGEVGVGAEEQNPGECTE